jgi:hypothetical protein
LSLSCGPFLGLDAAVRYSSGNKKILSGRLTWGFLPVTSKKIGRAKGGQQTKK